MRLFISCSELGLGHVSRIIPLGKLLSERGHELIFFSGGVAYQLLSREFENPIHPSIPNVRLRLMRVINDNIQHLGQVAYVRGMLRGWGWLGR